MTNSHTIMQRVDACNQWQPIRVPRRCDDREMFHVFMLLPGLSLAFYSEVLGRSRTSVSAYRAAALAAAEQQPAIVTSVESCVRNMTCEDGLAMARLRRRAHLPAWSRLAICEYRKRGYSRRDIATAFRCSPGTVANVLQGKGHAYAALSGDRQLTYAQNNPPGRWQRRVRLESIVACQNNWSGKISG